MLSLPDKAPENVTLLDRLYPEKYVSPTLYLVLIRTTSMECLGHSFSCNFENNAIFSRCWVAFLFQIGLTHISWRASAANFSHTYRILAVKGVRGRVLGESIKKRNNWDEIFFRIVLNDVLKSRKK